MVMNVFLLVLIPDSVSKIVRDEMSEACTSVLESQNY